MKLVPDYYVEEAKWSSEAARIKGNSEEARTINGKLELLKSEVFQTEKRLYMSDTAVKTPFVNKISASHQS